jgi:Cu-processing system permease protein
MRRLYEIAANTLRETLRNNVLYLVLFFVIALIVLSVFIADWSVFARVQVMQDFGLATMSIAGLLLAVFIGVGLLGREVSQKTLYNVVTKPVSRSLFVCGKFFGLFSTLVLTFAVMSVFFLLTLYFLGGVINDQLLWAILLIWAEMSVMISAAVLFSTLTSPMLASIYSLAFYVAGHFNDLLSLKMVEQKGSLYPALLRVIYFLVPNLEHFNVRDNVVYGIPLPPPYFGFAIAYGVLYTTLFLILSCALFSKKDL